MAVDRRSEGRRRKPDMQRRPRSALNYYSGNKSEPRLPAAPKPGLRMRARLLPSVVAAAVIIGSLLYSMTISTTPNVTTLTDTGSPYRELEAYADKADELLSSSLLNKTKLTVNSSKFEGKMLEAFPEVSAVALRLPVIGRKPTLVLDIKPPALVLTTNRRSLVLDNSGMAVADLRQLPDGVRQTLPVLQDQTDLEIAIGKQAITSNTVAFVESLTTQFEAKDLKITQLSLPSAANELDIRIEGVPYYIKTDTTGNARLQAGSFIAVYEQLKRQGITPKEYVDVRVEEKAFYR